MNLRRSAVILLILAALVELAAWDVGIWTVVVVALVVIAPGINLAVGVLLRLASRRSGIKSASLESRVRDADELWVSASMIGILGLNRIFNWGLPNHVTLGLLGTAILLISAPAVDWLLTWRREIREAIALELIDLAQRVQGQPVSTLPSLPATGEPYERMPPVAESQAPMLDPDPLVVPDDHDW